MSFRNNRGFRVESEALNEQHYIRIHEENKKYLGRIDFHKPSNNSVQVIDSYRENILIQYRTSSSTEEERIDRKYSYIRVKDSSTNKYVFLSVPNQIRNCKEAIAWTFGLSLPEYDLFFQT